MTTPHQPLPTTVETLLGIGAFQIGGGGTHFGQDIDEDFVNNLVKLPFATLGNMLTILRQALERLPIEALEAFRSIVPDWLEGEILDVAEAVDRIIDSLQDRTPIEALIALLAGGAGPGSGPLQDIFDRLQNLDADGLFDAANLLNSDGIPAIAALRDAVGGSTGASLTNIVERLQHLATGTGVLSSAGVPNLPASKITSGTFAESFLPSVTALRDAVGGATGATNTNIVDRLRALAPASGLISVADVVDDEDATVQTFLDGLRNAFEGGGSAVGSFINDVLGSASNIQGTASGAAQTGQAALSAINFASNEPMFTTLNPTLETNITIGALVKPSVTVDTQTTDPNNSVGSSWSSSDASAYNSHYHTLDAAVVGISADPHHFAVTQAASAMGFVRLKKTGSKDLLQWIGKGNTSVTSCKVHIYRMDTDTGDLTWLYTGTVPTGTLGTTNWVTVAHAITTPIDVSTGDVLAIEVCITGAGSHQIAGLSIPWIGDDTTVRPKRFGASRNSGTESSAPTTIADASVVYDQDIPYLGIGTGTPAPAVYSYFDDFQTSSGLWSVLAGSFQLDPGNAGTLEVATGSASCMVSPGVGTDKMRAKALVSRAGDAGGSEWQRVMICCDSGATNYVAMQFNSTTFPFDDGDITIITGTSPTDTGTVRATATNAWPGLGDYQYFSIEYDGVNTYHVYQGSSSTPVLSWTDSGGVVTHGSNKRRAGVAADRSAGDALLYNILIQDA